MAQKILIVDDEPEVCGLLVRYLKLGGFDSIIAGDGMKAIDLARSEKPDLIILDIGLPAGDGFWVLQKIKQVPAMAQIPIIAISGRDEETNRAKALQSGAQVFVGKPIKRDDLLAEVRKLLTGKPGGSSKQKILIIEDEPNFREMLFTYLQWAGFDVAVAGDSITAISAIMREKPDLILLDMGLPGGDGMIVLERVKHNPAMAGIPVIVVSGQDPAKYQERALRAGATAYFRKPFKNEALLESIRKALETPA